MVVAADGHCFGPLEVESIYVMPNDRFVVSLIVGYSSEDLEDVVDLDDDGEEVPYSQMSDERKAQLAAKAALDLTTDDGSSGTNWFVYDRDTGLVHQFEQSQFEEPDAGF